MSIVFNLPFIINKSPLFINNLFFLFNLFISDLKSSQKAAKKAAQNQQLFSSINFQLSPMMLLYQYTINQLEMQTYIWTEREDILTSNDIIKQLSLCLLSVRGRNKWSNVANCQCLNLKFSSSPAGNTLPAPLPSHPPCPTPLMPQALQRHLMVSGCLHYFQDVASFGGLMHPGISFKSDSVVNNISNTEKRKNNGQQVCLMSETIFPLTSK